MAKQLETRLRIAQCLDHLQESRALEKIKVKELCQAAGVSRTTFYSYFQDIYGVSEWWWDYSTKKILRGIGTQYGWEEGHRLMFCAMLAQQKSCRRKPQPGDNQASHDYADKKSLENHVERLEEKLGRRLTEQELFEMSYISHAFACMTRKWVNEGMKESPARMAALFAAIVPEFAIRAMGK